MRPSKDTTMKLFAETADPTTMIDEIRQLIRLGQIRTWVENTQGFFTHNGDNNRWLFKAFFQPLKVQGGVVFELLPPQSGEMDTDTIGIYAGSWSSELIRHFGDQIQSIVMRA
jgi:hypothetical protein